MKIGIQTLMKAKGAWHGFRENHPNVLPFMNDVFRKGINEDVQFEILVHYPDGESMECGARDKQSDTAFFDLLQEIM